MRFEQAGQLDLVASSDQFESLGLREPAIKYLQSAVNKLTDPGQLKMCRDELTGLQN
jgi:hypothetical protein